MPGVSFDLQFTQHAKKVVSDSPGLENFAVLKFSDWQLKFLEEFKLLKNCVINPAHQNVFGAS